MSQVVERVGWGRRLGDSFKGILVGLFLFVIAFVLLGWNELNTVRNYRTVAEGRKKVVEADIATVDPAKENQLIHLVGKATTEDILKDPDFDVKLQALRLSRNVEMYQWEERVDVRTEKKMGGSEERIKTYSYSKVWSERILDSSRFEGPDAVKYKNPNAMQFSSEQQVAQNATLGAYRLHPSLVSQMSREVPVDLESAMAPESIRSKTREVAGGLYIGSDPAVPQIGDMKVSFKQTPPGEVSVLARQAGGGLEAFRSAKTGKTIHMLLDGNIPSEDMFTVLKQRASMLAWILRVVGFIMMYAGLSLVFRPLSVLADVLPLMGTIVGIGTGLVAGIVSAVLTLITIAVCWFVVRPLVSIPLLVVAVFLLFKLKKPKAAPAAPTPATP